MNNQYPVRQGRLPRDISESLGKLPPQALDMEEAVLGAILLEVNAMPVVAGLLRPDHFYLEAHREIYSACFTLYSTGDPIDMRSCTATLRSTGKIELIGGAYYIADLTSKVSSSANIEYHARIIIEHYMKRELIHAAGEIQGRAYDDITDAFELLDFAADRIQSVDKDISVETNEKSVKEVGVENIKFLQARMAGESSGVPTGFVIIDSILHGWHPGHLVIVGGRPGMAKSTLLFQSLYHVSHDLGIPVGAFSLEMPGNQVVDRLACAIAEIDSDKVKNGTLTEYEFQRIMTAYGEISKCVYRIDDSPALHIADVRARAKRMVQKYGIKVLLVDYVQLMRGALAGERINRDQEIGNISRGLKAIAKENKICVIAISSLSREVEKRGGDKRPQLQDLRDSSNLESDADVVAFLYRPEVYKISTDEEGMPTNGLAEFIVAKHRDGSTGTVKLKFVGKFTKFSEWMHQPMTQDQYVKQHYKNPSETLPSQTPNFDEENPF